MDTCPPDSPVKDLVCLSRWTGTDSRGLSACGMHARQILSDPLPPRARPSVAPGSLLTVFQRVQLMCQKLLKTLSLHHASSALSSPETQACSGGQGPEMPLFSCRRPGGGGNGTPLGPEEALGVPFLPCSQMEWCVSQISSFTLSCVLCWDGSLDMRG